VLSFSPAACTGNTRFVLITENFAFSAPKLTNRVIKHIPFDYDKKVPFAIKTFLYLSTGFAIPFVASYYQLYVAPSLTTCHMSWKNLIPLSGLRNKPSFFPRG
jgi:hypothetical protein